MFTIALLPPGAVPAPTVWSQQGGGFTAPQDAGCPRNRYVASQGGFTDRGSGPGPFVLGESNIYIAILGYQK